MFLELKNVRSYLQVQLRSLVKTAKKKNIDLYVICKGKHYQTVTVTINNTGPFQEKTHFSLNMFACRDNHYCNISAPVVLCEPINVEEIIEELDHELENDPIVISPIQKPQFYFNSRNEILNDDQVQTIDIREYVTWFRSRYLIDAPRKILFFTLLSRGFDFSAFMHESSGFIFQGGSFCSAKTKMRTRLCNFHHQVYANTLRSLRLEQIRQDLQPYWDAKVKEYSSTELPDTVLFSSQCLMKLAYACIKCLKSNDSIWNWLKLLDQTHQSDIPRLYGSIEHEKHPVLENILNQFNHWSHPAGSINEHLDDLFKGKTSLFDEAIYINDIHVSIEGDRIHALSLGSSLFLSKNSPPNILNDSFQFDLEGEIIQSGDCSNQMRLLQMPDENLIEVPKFMVIKDIKKQILLTASQTVG